MAGAVPPVGATSPSRAPARSYVAVLKPGAVADKAASQAAQQYGVHVTAIYTNALQGYAATMTAGEVRALRHDPSVAYVERDQTIHGLGTPSPASSRPPSNAGMDTPQSCLHANTTHPDPIQLSQCLRGLGTQHPERVGGIAPQMELPSVPAKVPPCVSAPGDDRCETWVARFNHSKGYIGEFATGMAVSPIGDQVFLAGVDVDLQRQEATMAVVAYDARTGRKDWASLPFTGSGGGCGGCFTAGIAVSPDGTRVYVTGYMPTADGGDIRTLALNATSGAVVWDNQYQLASADQGTRIAVSPNGRRVYVSGITSSGQTYGNLVSSYDARTGLRQWTHSSLGEIYAEMRATTSGVFVTGFGLNPGGSHFDAVTAALDGSNGTQLWHSAYNGGAGAVGGDVGLDLTVSPAGNRIYINGYSTTGLNNQLSWLTAAYAARDGHALWTQLHADRAGTNVAHAIAVSPTGERVYSAGYTHGPDGMPHPTTVAYDARTGAPVWTETYAPQRFTYGAFLGVTVSPDGSRVFLTGFNSNVASGNDRLTLALDATNGADHWVARYNSAYRSAACLSYDAASFIGISPDGQQVYAAGNFNLDYASNPVDFGIVAYASGGGVSNPQPGRLPAPPASECPQLLPRGVDQIDADISSTQAGNGSGTVSGVNVYVLDEGIARNSPELNVVNRVNFTGGPNTDCADGHGTAVAGVIGARDDAVGVVGVAPGVPLTSVKVFDCSGVGTLSQVLSGIDWVAGHAAKPAVANMSLEFASNPAIDDAVKASADSGVFYSLMAGDEGGNCEDVSPSRIGDHPGVMTVGALATRITGSEVYYSNFGPCVSIWAPGEVYTTGLHGLVGVYYGTEIASAHVAGAAALYLSSHPRTSPAALKRTLERDGVLTGFTSKDGITPVLQVYAGRY